MLIFMGLIFVWEKKKEMLGKFLTDGPRIWPLILLNPSNFPKASSEIQFLKQLIVKIKLF